MAIKKADELFSKHVRSRGWCEHDQFPFPLTTLKHNGNLQCAHIRSRRYMSIRWADDNALALCAAHHLYYTHHPLEWEQWCIDHGIDYDGLRLRGLNDPPMDPYEVIERFRAAPA